MWPNSHNCPPVRHYGAVPDVTDLRPGDPEEIAGYRVLSRLGAGGQGVVYLADAPSGERVAIKQLRFGPQDVRARQQFAKEVAAARLVAPFCTAQVLDAELDGPSPYVVSEYIEGLSLQQRIERRGPMTGASLQRLAIGTATALAAIHQAGVVHRDFKPANVMLAYDGPRVIDFGIARDLSTDTTVTSKVFGTPAYMAPEQLRAERVGPATDMFAWASVIAYAATGRAPFDAPHMAAVMHRISSGEPDLTGVPATLIAVLRQCLDKDPAGRPTAQQALALLLGRPAPQRDASDATQVLAEATGIVHAAAAATTTQDRPQPALPTADQAGPATTVRAPAATQATPTTPTTAVQPPQPAPQLTVPDRPAARPWGDGNVVVPGSPSDPARRGPRAGVVAALLALVLGGSFAVYAAGTGWFDNLRGVADPTASSSPTPSPRGAEPAKPSPTAPATTKPSNTWTPTPSDGQSDPADSIPETFDGTWEGFGLQPRGRVTSWSVKIDLDEGETTGKMKLESLDCSGTLDLLAATADELQFLATMDDDPKQHCAASSVVRLTRLGSERLSFAWQDRASADNSATGVLRRN